MRRRPAARAFAALGLGLVLSLPLSLAACGSHWTGSATPRATTANPAHAGIPPALVSEARPIGRTSRFHPPATGPVIGSCRRALGPRSGVHVEVFAANRVVLLAAGIGVRRPVAYSQGRIVRAACYGDVVTLEPTGVVLVAPRCSLTLAAVFRAWGQPLSRRRLASFRASAAGVRVFINGRRFRGSQGGVPLTRHAEIVLEVGPYVPPHRRYTFPPGT